MRKQSDIKDIITLIISMISIIVPSIFFILTSSEEIKTQTYLIFIGILSVLIISIFIIYIYSRWKDTIKNVKYNGFQIKDIKRNINLKDLFHSIDKRLTILEMLSKNNKKAEIDPRIIIWIVLLILLFLFLKSIGIFG